MLSRSTATSNTTPSRLIQYPILVNTFFLSIPLVLCATVVPLTLSINSTFNTSFKDYRALNTLLSKASIAFQNGQQTSQADLATMGVLNGKLEASFLLLVSRWSNLFAAWAIFVGIVGVVSPLTDHFRVCRLRLELRNFLHSGSLTDFHHRFSNSFPFPRTCYELYKNEAIKCSGLQ